MPLNKLFAILNLPLFNEGGTVHNSVYSLKLVVVSNNRFCIIDRFIFLPCQYLALDFCGLL